MDKGFWKVLAIFESVIILSGLALAFVYADYKAGALPYDIKGILDLIMTVGFLGLFIGGYIGWVIVLTYIFEGRGV